MSHRTSALAVIPGVVPSPLAWPTGCRFADRCRHAFDRCGEQPPLLGVDGGTAACWLKEAPDR
jgi:oligopeptide/dipeptide ABC transporter ATP-binding protein